MGARVKASLWAWGKRKMTPMRDGTVGRVVRTGTALAVLLVGAGAGSGCYERVTRAEGFGADRISTEAPNRTQGPIDTLIFGKDQPTVRTTSGTFEK